MSTTTSADKSTAIVKRIIGAVVVIGLAIAAIIGGTAFSDSQKHSEAELATRIALLQIAQVEPITVVQLSAGNNITDEYAALDRLSEQLGTLVLPTDLGGKTKYATFDGTVTQALVTSPTLRDGRWLSYPYADMDALYRVDQTEGQDALPGQIGKLLAADEAGKAEQFEAYSAYDLIGVAKRAQKMATAAQASHGVVENDSVIGTLTTGVVDQVIASIDTIDQTFAAYPNATAVEQAALRDAAIALKPLLTDDTYLIGDITSPNSPSKPMISPITLEEKTAAYFAAHQALATEEPTA